MAARNDLHQPVSRRVVCPSGDVPGRREPHINDREGRRHHRREPDAVAGRAHSDPAWRSRVQRSLHWLASHARTHAARLFHFAPARRRARLASQRKVHPRVVCGGAGSGRACSTWRRAWTEGSRGGSAAPDFTIELVASDGTTAAAAITRFAEIPPTLKEKFRSSIGGACRYGRDWEPVFQTIRAPLATFASIGELTFDPQKLWLSD